jgi:predicted NBD/HSP70 family sugar kinase
MSREDLTDPLDDRLDALPAWAVDAGQRALAHTAWAADPMVRLTYDADRDELVASAADLPVRRERHLLDDLTVLLDGADDSALLVELRLRRFAAALRSPAADRARGLLGPGVWHAALGLLASGGTTLVQLDAAARDSLLDICAELARPVRVLGVQVLPDRLTGVVVDERGEVLGEEVTVPLPRPRPEAVAHGVADLLAAVGQDVAAVGLQIGAPVDTRSGIVHHFHKGEAYADAWVDLDLRELVTTAVGREVHLVNDVVALATNERWSGLGRELDRYGVLLVAEGVGGALVRDGRPNPDTPMELGNIVIHPLGRKCHCGNRGCVEATAGAWAIIERVNEESYPNEVVDLEAAAALAGDGQDPLIVHVFREAGEDLAVGIGSAQALLAFPAWVVYLPAALIGDGPAAAAFRFGMDQWANSVSYEPYRHSALVLREATDGASARGAALTALERFALGSPAGR